MLHPRSVQLPKTEILELIAFGDDGDSLGLRRAVNRGSLNSEAIVYLSENRINTIKKPSG